MPSSTYSSSSSYNSTARVQRHEVKQIAADCDSIINTYRKESNAGLTELKIARLQNALAERQERLELLRAQGLSVHQPSPGALSQVRSQARLAGGTLSRGAAILGSRVGAATQLGFTAASLPFAVVTGAIIGAVEGGILGSAVSSHALISVPAAVVSAGAGIAIGAGAGPVVTTFNAIPDLANRGSLPKKVFRSIDNFPAARAHVQRKSMSTSAIASHTAALISHTIFEMESKSVLQMSRPNHAF